MSPEPKKEVPAGEEPTGTRDANKKSLTGALTTGLGAILMLTAIAVIPDPTLRLVVVSLGGWMIGGSR